jgi:uncharacterized membrane-anchored protein
LETHKKQGDKRMNHTVKTGLIAAIAFQCLVLSGMVIKAALPLWTGQEIKVNTVPVDPRSLFRGNYARLRYEFNEVSGRYFKDEGELRVGDVVYITLESNEENLYEFADAHLEKPKAPVFLRGRIASQRFGDKDDASYQIRYGIDAFFAPKEKALSLEKDLRTGGIATLMIASDGRARIKTISPP